MKKTMLAIDDDSFMLEYYKEVLAQFGEIRTATNLTEARKQLSGVDLILLDFNLEGDNERIQELVPELKKVAPVLLCSGIQDVEVPNIGVESGIYGYWNKGSDIDRLHSLIRSGLQANPICVHAA